MTTRLKQLGLPKGLLIALLITTAAYLPALGSYFQLDDWAHLLNLSARQYNPWAFGGWFYRPLFLAVGKELYKTFGLNAWGWHTVCLIFHLANVTFVYYLIRRLKFSPTAAFVGSLIFGLYPSHPDAVSWICALSGLMGGFFGLIAVHVSLAKRIPTVVRGILCALIFALALLSKEEAASLALMIVFLPILTDENRNWRDSIKWVLACSPLALVLAGMVHLEMQCHVAGGNQHGLFSLAIIRRAGMFVVWSLRGTMPLSMASTIGKLIVITIVPLVVWKKLPNLRPGILWFFGTGMGIGIALGSLPPTDRYVYLPSIGVALCFAGIADLLLSRKNALSFNAWVILGTSTLALAYSENKLLQTIVIVALLFAFAANSAFRQTKTRSSILPSVVCMIFCGAEYLWYSAGRGFFSDWVFLLAPIGITILIAVIRASRSEEMRPGATLLCACTVFWCMLPQYMWFLAGMAIIEFLGCNLKLPSCCERLSTKGLSTNYCGIGVLSILMALSLYSITLTNVGWLDRGRDLVKNVGRVTKVYAGLPKNASLLITNNGAFIQPDPWIDQMIAKVVANRPDIRLTIDRSHLGKPSDYDYTLIYSQESKISLIRCGK